PDDAVYQEIVTRSQRASAPIHFLDTRGLQGASRYHDVEFGPRLGRAADEGPFAWSLAAEGATALADETGGLAVRATNDMAKALSGLLDTMTAYYVLAYQPPPNERAGYRRITVDVHVRGLHARARRGYYSGASTTR